MNNVILFYTVILKNCFLDFKSAKFCIVSFRSNLGTISFSMLIKAKLLRCSPAIVGLKNVFINFNFLKFLSRLAVVTGILIKILKVTHKLVKVFRDLLSLMNDQSFSGQLYFFEYDDLTISISLHKSITFKSYSV